MESAKNTSAGNRNDGITKLIPDNEISLSSDTEISWQNLTAEDEQQGDHQAALDGAQHLDLADVDSQQDEDDDV